MDRDELLKKSKRIAELYMGEAGYCSRDADEDYDYDVSEDADGPCSCLFCRCESLLEELAIHV